jgi:2-methylisocitrate lyase-like PEP mutase family enzyme
MQGIRVANMMEWYLMPQKSKCSSLFTPRIHHDMQGIRVANMMECNLTPMHTPAELKAMGFHIIIHPLSGLYAATRALVNVYELLAKKGTTRDDLDNLVNFK